MLWVLLNQSCLGSDKRVNWNMKRVTRGRIFLWFKVKKKNMVTKPHDKYLK